MATKALQDSLKIATDICIVPTDTRFDLQKNSGRLEAHVLLLLSCPFYEWENILGNVKQLAERHTAKRGKIKI